MWLDNLYVRRQREVVYPPWHHGAAPARDCPEQMKQHTQYGALGPLDFCAGWSMWSPRSSHGWDTCS